MPTSPPRKVRWEEGFPGPALALFPAGTHGPRPPCTVRPWPKSCSAWRAVGSPGCGAVRCTQGHGEAARQARAASSGHPSMPARPRRLGRGGKGMRGRQADSPEGGGGLAGAVQGPSLLSSLPSLRAAASSQGLSGPGRGHSAPSVSPWRPRCGDSSAPGPGPGCLLEAAVASARTQQGSGPGHCCRGLCSRDCAALVLRAQLGSGTACSTCTEPARERGPWGPRRRPARGGQGSSLPPTQSPLAACPWVPASVDFTLVAAEGTCQRPLGLGVGPWLRD